MSKREANIANIYPLSPMQEGMLFHTLASPNSGAYFNQKLFTLTGSVQEAALQRAWQEVVQRHEVLRTLFIWEDRRKPLQVVRDQVRLPWHTLDWRGLSTSEQTVKLEDLLQADRRMGFDLGQAPLMRFTLIRMEEKRYELLWSQHHLLMDGLSGSLVLKEAMAIYGAISQEREWGLEPPMPYSAYISWLQEQDLFKAESFWRAALKGFTAPTPLYGARVNEARFDLDYEVREQQAKAPSALVTALTAFGRQHDLTLSTIVHAAWALLLSRYSDEADIVFGSTVFGRPSGLTGVESAVGLFINTMPVRAQFSSHDLALSWLKDFQYWLLEMRQYEYSPLIEVQGWSEVHRDQPLFESLLVFENYPVDAAIWQQHGAMKISNVRTSERTNYPLTVTVMPRNELAIKLQYDARRFDATAITKMLGHFYTLLEGLVSNPYRRLSDLPLLTGAERQQLLVDWNRTEVSYREMPCLHEAIEEQAKRTPEAVAVVFKDAQLTYRQLNERANQLAHHLRKLGVGPNTLVGICMQRSLEVVIGLLGILKAGGAYVPMDPEYPMERLALILQDAGATVLLTQRQFIGKLGRQAGVNIVSIDSHCKPLESESRQNLHTNVGADDLIYAIYTSGSSGIPKGAGVFYRGFMNLMHWFITEFAINSGDSVLLVSSLSFDLTQKNIYAPLMCGGKLHLSAAGPFDPDLIVDSIHRNQITLLNCTPSAFYPLIEPAGPSIFEKIASLRCVFLGGEPILIPRLRPWFGSEICRTDLVNTYGPTECSDVTAFYRLNKSDLENYEYVPTGKPISNTQVVIVNKDLQLCPVGVRGEVCIAGVGVGAGYLNNSELTSAKFIDNPFPELSGQKLYKTGDLARYLPNGAFEYLGRLDFQVKVRGFRIELGEIESILAALPGVREAVVVAREDVPDEKRLVAYLTTDGKEKPKESELRGLLQAKLPDHMVPSAFVSVDSFPLTPSGKIDRKALPPPDVSTQQTNVAPLVHRTLTEGTLARIWCKVLNLDRVSVRDNFFDLGGHSLLAVRVIGEINKVLNVHLNIPAFFQNPTIEQLAKVLRQELYLRPDSQVMPLQAGHTGLPLYFIGAGGAECRIAQLIGGDRAIFAVDIPMPEEWRPAIAAAKRAALPTVKELGLLYANLVRTHAGSSPCVIVGYSFFGKVAFEAADALQRAGGTVACVLLVDAGVWSGITRGPAWERLRWIWSGGASGVVSDTPRIYRLSASLADSFRLLRWFLAQTPRVVKGRIAETCRKINRRLGGPPPPTVIGDSSMLDKEGFPVELGVFLRFARILEKSFDPSPIDAFGVLIRTKFSGDEMLPGLTNGWRGLFTQGLQIVPAQGTHNSIVSDEQDGAAMGRQINAVLDQLPLVGLDRGKLDERPIMNKKLAVNNS